MIYLIVIAIFYLIAMGITFQIFYQDDPRPDTGDKIAYFLFSLVWPFLFFTIVFFYLMQIITYLIEKTHIYYILPIYWGVLLVKLFYKIKEKKKRKRRFRL